MTNVSICTGDTSDRRKSLKVYSGEDLRCGAV